MDSTRTKNSVGVALCGLGRAGSIHLGCIRKNYRYSLKYVVELVDRVLTLDGEEQTSVGAHARRTLDRFNLQHVKVVDVKDFEDQVLLDATVEAVVIATPTFTHHSYVTKSLAAKKAVFCEKPIADNVEDIDGCFDTAASLSVPLYCAFNRRFDAGMAGVRKGLRDGKIGKVYSIKTTSRDSPLPSLDYIKISGGIFHDCAVHDIDMLCWVLGEMPESVSVMASCFDAEYEAVGDVDTVSIVLKFPSKVLGTVDLSRHSNHGYDQRLEVFGDKGMLQCANVPEDPVLLTSSASGPSSSPLLFSFPQRYELAYQLEHDHFIDCILDPSQTISVTHRDVAMVTKIAQACERSLKEGRVVKVEA